MSDGDELDRLLDQLLYEGNQVDEQGTVGRHRGPQILLPQGMTLEQAMQSIAAMNDSQETQFVREYKYRPYDGAAAFLRVLEREYGSKGFGTATQTMFGRKPPQRVSVKVSPTEAISVPWGEVTMPTLGVFNSTYTHGDHGPVYLLCLTTAQNREAEAEAFFDLVEKELQANSIYRGKAIDGSAMKPDFINLDIDPNQVIYNAETTRALESDLWMPLEQRELMASLGLPVKRGVLLEGDYGTGKTTAALLSAQKAVANNWTFIYCRPGDEVEEVMETAKLYPPAMVFIEDIDRRMEDGDPEAVTEILDVFDGIKSKAQEIVVVATTNHVERLHKGMFRPGRLDAVLTIGACDANGVETLLRATIQDGLLKDIDWGQVTGALQGMTPAFVREAGDRAVRYAVARVGGRPTALLTEDLMLAAKGLSAQKEQMDAGINDETAETLDAALGRVLREALQGTRLSYDGRSDDQYLDTSNPVKAR